MKKLLQKTVALALAAVTMIASTIIVANAEETETTSTAAAETTVIDTTDAETTTTTEFDFSEGMKNVALGKSYSYARLVGEPGSEEEGAGGFANPMLNDDECTKLTDGKTIAGAETKNSAGPAGTARSYRIKFDFGSEKKVSKIALLDMYNGYDRDYQGSPSNNRGFELDTIMVQAGEDVLAMFEVETEKASTLYPDTVDFYKVYITLKEEVVTRYLWIDIQTAQPKGAYDASKDTGAYVISLDEIEIYGEDAGEEPVDTETTATETETTAAATTETENENAVYDMAMAITSLEEEDDGKIEAGEKIGVAVTPINIVSENGLMSVAFTLKYDASKVTPDVVSEDPEKCDVYDEFMIVSPQYVMSAAGMDISTNSFENISRHYDGYYEFKFLDKITYAMQKSGTEAENRVKDNGDLIIVVPFTVKEDVAAGDEIVFEVTEVGGTDAGNADVQPYSIEGNGCKASVIVGEEIAEDTTTTTEEAGKDDTTATSEKAGKDDTTATSEKAGEDDTTATSEKAGDTSAEASKTTESGVKPPKTGDSGIVLFIAFALLALVGGVVVVKKTSK